MRKIAHNCCVLFSVQLTGFSMMYMFWTIYQEAWFLLVGFVIWLEKIPLRVDKYLYFSWKCFIDIFKYLIYLKLILVCRLRDKFNALLVHTIWVNNLVCFICFKWCLLILCCIFIAAWLIWTFTLYIFFHLCFIFCIVSFLKSIEYLGSTCHFSSLFHHYFLDSDIFFKNFVGYFVSSSREVS